RSAVPMVGETISTSVETLLVALTSTTPAGVVTVAVFVIAPTAAPLTVPVTVYVMDDPAGSVTVLLMLPVPEAVLPVAPPVVVEVKDAPVMVAGTTSATVAPV